jgi:hypothetical protein
LVGVQPVFTQVPPKCLRSITATLRPAATRRRASEGPAWPVPMTIASNFGMAAVLRRGGGSPNLSPSAVTCE